MNKKEIYVRTTRAGDSEGVSSFLRVDGIEIDNYANRKIYRKGKLIEEIDETRELPKTVKPPIIHPRPDPKAKLILIDHKNPFWTLNPTIKRDITCWKVVKDGNTSLFDAVTGEEIGTGIPIPTEKAISLSGFHEDAWPDPWYQYRQNATYWFDKWGYDTWDIFAPQKSQHEGYVSNNACKYRYALAHGGSTSFTSAKDVHVYAANIESWLENRDKMEFAFLGHCGGMDTTGPGSLSYAFRKGSMANTVTIGFTQMSTHGEDCWPNSLNWQKKLFEKVDTGTTWKTAFDYAQACYPECQENIKLVGDETLTLIGGTGNMVLNINSDPQGQEVIIDGENVGVTPVSETVTCTEHNIMVQPSGVVEDPDLWIEDVWATGTTISYRIKNIGGGVAGSSHTKLKVDGVEKETIAEGGLNPDQSREVSFAHSWECSGDNDTIEVVADCNGEVSEGNEGNNSLEKVITCDSGCIGIDLIPIEIFVQYGKVAYKIKNQGTVAAPSVYTRHNVFFQNVGSSSWQYQGFNRAGSHAAGTIRTFRSYVTWPSSGTKIKVHANGSNSYIECNTENNEMIVTA